MAKRRFARLLEQATPAVVRAVEQRMFAAGEAVRTAAQISITTGATSGRFHVPSLPNTPPNNDTGYLANNITVLQVGRLRVLITSEAKYSAFLEYGTSRMQPRPSMLPAAVEAKPTVNKLLRDAARLAIRAHFRRR